MALTIAQFRAEVVSDREKLRRGEAPEGVEQCYNCKIPLQESITGNRAVTLKGVLMHACSDCFYESIGGEIDDYPIFMPRVPRG